MSLFGDIGAGLSAINPLAALGTASAVAGPVLGYLGQQDTNANNAAIAAASNATSAANAQSQEAMELNFAQNGISWRIADAAKNGISPLAALGSTEPSYTPVMPVMDTPSYSSPMSTLSAGIPEMSQNLSRALTATTSPDSRLNSALDLAFKQKQNDLLDVQIANAKLQLVAHSTPPPIPTASYKVRNEDGTVSTYPSDPQALHGMPFGNWRWQLSNGLQPDNVTFENPFSNDRSFKHGN